MSEEVLTRPLPPADLRLPYGSEPFQFADLRLPPGPGPHPVAVVLHGGFWRARYDLAAAGHLAAALCSAGIATWNVEYRRLGNPGGGWPGTFEDVAAALDALGEIAAGHALDPDRVVTVGHSAGGHLALWLAARPRIAPADPLHGPSPLPLRGGISLGGVVDLQRAWELGLSNRVVEELLGGTPATVPERYASASPFALLPLGVPQALVHGTADPSVPYELSEQYYETARRLGDDVTLVPLQGAGHFEVIDPVSEEWPVVERAVIDLLRR